MRSTCSTLISTHPQRHWYQGDYSELDPETGLQAFDLRMYSSRIGRWLSVDPYAQYWSPYLAMGNNPVSQVDPDGGKSKNSNSGPGGTNGQTQAFDHDVDGNITGSWGMSMSDGGEAWSGTLIDLPEVVITAQRINAPVSTPGLSSGNREFLSRNASMALAASSVPLSTIDLSVNYAKKFGDIGKGGRVLSNVVKGASSSLTAVSLIVSAIDYQISKGTPLETFYLNKLIGGILIQGLNGFNVLLPGLGTGMSVTAGIMDASGVFDPMYSIGLYKFGRVMLSPYNPSSYHP